MAAIVVSECGPFYDHGLDADGIPIIGYRTCDFCYESACDDIWAGNLNESEWRRFYLIDDSECVCDNCLPNIDFTEPAKVGA